MSFYTALTGLNAATAQMGVTSNNIANVSTTGFKRSRTDFGDIFATSPLQKASATIGQGVALKKVTQEFGQGNLVFSSNTLDLAISGDGFFPLKSQDGFQDIFTRNGVFMTNDQYNEVNQAGQKLMAASVDSSGKANLDDMNVLTIPQKTTGMATQTSKVQLGLNFPADATVITKDFNRNDPTTYNKSTALTVYDAGGNSYLASVYYVKTQNASQATPNNKWQTYVYVGDKLVSASLQQATNTTGELMYVNKYGELKAKSDFKTPTEIAELNSSFSKKTVKFSLDDLTDVRTSVPATVTAGKATDLGTGSNDGIDIGSYLDVNKTDLLISQGSSSVDYKILGSSDGVVATDQVNVTFEHAGVTTSVSVPSTDGSVPNAVDMAAALNSNVNFASSFVAQAPTSATLTNLQYPATPASTNFSSFSISIGGKDISIPSFSATSATALAAEIQAGLRKQDNGDSTITVVAKETTTGSNIYSLKITDTAGREVKNVSLTAAGGATFDAVSASTYSSGKLKITAIDPNVSASQIATEFTVTQGTKSSVAVGGVAAAIVSTKNETEYQRFMADYAVGSDPSTFKAVIGTGANAVTISGDPNQSVSDFVNLLNSKDTFNSLYKASLSGDGLKIVITALDPSTANADAITKNLTISNATATLGGGSVGTNGTTQVVSTLGPSKATAPELVGKKSIDDLNNLFSINVDGSLKTVHVSLDNLVRSMASLPSTVSKKLSGTQIASELTNVIARAYGDEQPLNFSSIPNPTFSINLTPSGKAAIGKIPINLAATGDMHPEDLVREVQNQVDAQSSYKGKVVVSYDFQLQKLVFKPTDSTSKVTLSSAQSAMNLSNDLVQGVNDDSVGLPISPSVTAAPFTPANEQRYGMKVEYDGVTQSFVFKSGTTGDASSIAVTNIRPGSLATQSSKGLGMTGDASSYVVAPSTVDALRGIASKPAVLTGNPMAVNVDNNFSVDATNNQFVVSVNGITGTVTIPPKDTYTLGTYMEALQQGINNLEGPSKNGMTPESVNGVKVTYDSTKNSLVFTTGTASTDSYIKVTGDARWGLDGLDAKFGTTTTWIKPKPFTDSKGATVYIDGFGNESSSAAGFDTLPSWSPVYFDKGELTFDTAGNLVSPKQGAQLDTVYLPNGKGALTINIDYSKSTQFASPFSVLSQSQDGAPEGDLVGLAIKDDGLVQASYSNGAQKSLAKVVLVNFSNPSGLRQIGDTNYYKTSDSGTPKYGEAGSAGFGTVRSGATERANVDLTQELVDLITEQRNFQANAKAMETSTSMTNTIIQIRN
jgi:flagellar hook-basal body protein